MVRSVVVCPTAMAVVDRAIGLIHDRLDRAIAERGYFSLVLAGGSTPKILYEACASQAWPWEKFHIFWGDERYVSPDHADSNEGMARRAWLDHVPIPREQIHAMPTAAGDPQWDAQTYAQTLQTFFAKDPAGAGVFDMVLLGMGDDGHTASLFPHTAALDVDDRLVTVGTKSGEPRLTLTYPPINQANSVVFLVTGANKRSALAQVLASEGDRHLYPARGIAPMGDLWWLLDEAAGAGLATEPQ